MEVRMGLLREKWFWLPHLSNSGTQRLLFSNGFCNHPPFPWRGAGVVERGGLENRCTFASTQGSNPCLSARYRLKTVISTCSAMACVCAAFARTFNALCHVSAGAAADHDPALNGLF